MTWKSMLKKVLLWRKIISVVVLLGSVLRRPLPLRPLPSRNALYKIAVLTGMTILIVCLNAAVLKVTVTQNYTQHNGIHQLDGRKLQVLETKEQQRYTILWRFKHLVMHQTISKDDRTVRAFDSCEYKNCNITYDARNAHKSDAVIFHLIKVSPRVMSNRPIGQVWILFEDESPDRMSFKPWRKSQWTSPFNWSMTYDLTKTDIPFPYGEIRKRQTYTERNFTGIALQKKNDAIMMSSHCVTNSERARYVNILKKYISVKILGRCGEKWDCGSYRIHDDCFKILNEYRYFLAFENSLCRNYFTEKVFDNLQYDAVIVTRGGLKGGANEILPNDTFVSTDKFDSIESLGNYLKNISVEEYAGILKRKHQYFNIGYTSVYKRAMCEICKRMNNQEKYRKTIPNPDKWMYSDTSCRIPDDIK